MSGPQRDNVLRAGLRSRAPPRDSNWGIQEALRLFEEASKPPPLEVVLFTLALRFPLTGELFIPRFELLPQLLIGDAELRPGELRPVVGQVAATMHRISSGEWDALFGFV
jgi:hypothetical protein